MTSLNHNTGKRFDFRIEPAQKCSIERAASILGMSLTQFAKTTLIDRAQEVIQKYNATVLSDHDRDIFLKLLDDDAAPNAALRKAAKRYKTRRDAQLESKAQPFHHRKA